MAPLVVPCSKRWHVRRVRGVVNARFAAEVGKLLFLCSQTSVDYVVGLAIAKNVRALVSKVLITLAPFRFL